MAAIERLSVLRYVTTTKKSKRYLRAMYVMNAANASVAMSGQLNFDMLISDMGGARIGCEDFRHKPSRHELLPKSRANDLCQSTNHWAMIFLRSIPKSLGLE